MEPFNRLPADSRNAQSAHYGNDSGDHLLIVAAGVFRIAHLPATEAEGRDGETSVTKLALLHVASVSGSGPKRLAGNRDPALYTPHEQV